MTLGNFGVALALAAAVGAAVGRKKSRVRFLSTAVFAFVLFVPLGDLALAAYFRAIVGELSVTSMVLLLLSVVRNLFGSDLPARERSAVLACVVPSGLSLYPMALGLGPFDPYSIGFGAGVLLYGLALVALGATFLGFRLLPVVLAGSMTAFAFDVHESSNLWDYWIDPWLFFGATLWTLRRITVFVSRSKSR